jgi:nucleoside-diphosphate-sugar epimerase
VKVPVLGGMKFLGRGVVDAALADGHDITLFNRGQTSPALYPTVETIHGDLTGDLDGLRGGSWDAAVDLDPTQLPRHTRTRAVLRDAAGHYVFVSTISVYSDPSVPLGESSPVEEPPNPEPDEFVPEQYGALKVGSERVVQDVRRRAGGAAHARRAPLPRRPRREPRVGGRPDAARRRRAALDGATAVASGRGLRGNAPGRHLARARCRTPLRPLEETARDTLAWCLEAGEQRPTLTCEKERQLLEAA